MYEIIVLGSDLMLTRAPKGTNDILPEKAHIWQYIEREILKICDEYNFK